MYICTLLYPLKWFNPYLHNVTLRTLFILFVTRTVDVSRKHEGPIKPRVPIIQFTITVQLTHLRSGANATWTGWTLTSISSLRVARANMSMEFPVEFSRLCKTTCYFYTEHPRFYRRNTYVNDFKIFFKFMTPWLFGAVIAHCRISNFFSSFLKISYSCRCSCENTDFFFFYHCPYEDPQLISSGLNDLGICTRAKGPDCTVLLRVRSCFDSSVCLVCCGAVRRAMVWEGVLKMGHEGWHSSRGLQPEFLLAPLSSEGLQGGGGGWGWLKSPTCLGTWKAWLTIPFEATGYKGAGHWQVRTKMGLIVYYKKKKTRGEDCTWLEATLIPSPSSSTNWPPF